MNIDPAAILAIISGQAQIIATLEAENAALRHAIGTPPPAPTPAD